MGASSSKQCTKLANPTIYIYYKNDKDTSSYWQTMTSVSKCMNRLGLITAFDLRKGMNNPASIMFEFEKGCDENDVWDYVKGSVSSNLKKDEYNSVKVSCNYMNADCDRVFSEKTLDDMRDHIKDLVRLMIKTSSLYLNDGKSRNGDRDVIRL